jgi:ABC-type uncharacterized transport system substrate-binding protein
MTLNLARRKLLAALGGAAVAWPLAARAQQRDRVKGLGVLWGLAENDNAYEPYLSAFEQRLQDLGWIDGRNVRVEYRFTGGVTERIRIAAHELVALAPDVIFATTNPAVAALLQETQTIPIVFTLVSDSVGSGFVPSLAHPGGNITGFHNFEPELSGKWLQILKEVAPEVRRVAFLHHPQTAAHIGFLRVIEAASSSVGVTVTAAGVRDASEIEPALKALRGSQMAVLSWHPVRSLLSDASLSLHWFASSICQLSIHSATSRKLAAWFRMELIRRNRRAGVRLTLIASCVEQIQVNSRYNCRRGTSWQ